MTTSTKIIIGLLSVIVFAELAYFFAWKQKVNDLEESYKA